MPPVPRDRSVPKPAVVDTFRTRRPCGTDTRPVRCRRVAGAVLALSAAASAAAPPAVNLMVSLRLQPMPAAESAGPPDTGWRVGTAATRTEPVARPPVLNLRLRNGGQAEAQLGHWHRVATQQWLWTPQGAGLTGGVQAVPSRLRMHVQADWAGGPAPVRLGYGWEAPLSAARPGEAAVADAPPPTLAASGEVWAGFGAWVTVGWLRPADAVPAPAPAAPDGGQVWHSGAAAPAPAGLALQLRVLRE